MRILALDMGERRIGVALSDPTHTLARSLMVVARRDDRTAIEQVVALVQEREVERVVVGYPLSLEGDVGPQAERVRQFARALARRLEVPVELWDERFSTVDAERVLRQQGVGGRRKRGRIDATAAAIVLQDYLDAKAGARTQEVGEP